MEAFKKTVILILSDMVGLCEDFLLIVNKPNTVRYSMKKQCCTIAYDQVSGRVTREMMHFWLTFVSNSEYIQILMPVIWPHPV